MPLHQETRRPIVLAVIAAGLIISAAMGIRQTFGLFLGPFAFDRGLPVTTVAFAIALHNLTWGLAQPVAGMAAALLHFPIASGPSALAGQEA